MSKFRVARFLQRDLVVRVNFLNERGIIQNQRKFFEFYPDNNQESNGWYSTTDQVLLESIKEATEQTTFHTRDRSRFAERWSSIRVFILCILWW